MRKYLYLIKKQKIKSWLKFWLLTNNKFNIILSSIIEGTSFNLQNTVKKRFKIFNIFGNSVQNGTPTPTNPVPIHSVADDVNLLNNTATSQVINGITYTIKEDKSVVANGTATAHSILNLYGNLTISAGTYTFSGCPSNGSWATYSIGFGSKNDSGNGATFTETSDFTGQPYIRIANGTTVNNLIFRPKLQKGTVVTPYSPYNYGTFTIDFEGQTENYNYTFITKPLRSLPNGVRDSLEADGIHRKIVIQTGTLSQPTTITLSDAKQNGAYMCNIKSAGTLTGQTIELEAGDYEIIYELEEEIIEPYSEEQQEQYNKIKELYTFDGTTNISSNDEVPPYLQIQYYMKGE